jgi:hypothetical protein
MIPNMNDFKKNKALSFFYYSANSTICIPFPQKEFKTTRRKKLGIQFTYINFSSESIKRSKTFVWIFVLCNWITFSVTIKGSVHELNNSKIFTFQIEKSIVYLNRLFWWKFIETIDQEGEQKLIYLEVEKRDLAKCWWS